MAAIITSDEQSLTAASKASVKQYCILHNLESTGTRPEMVALIRARWAIPAPEAVAALHARIAALQLQVAETDARIAAATAGTPRHPAPPISLSLTPEGLEAAMGGKKVDIFVAPQDQLGSFEKTRVTVPEAMQHFRATLGVTISRLNFDAFRAGHWHLMRFGDFGFTPSHWRPKLVTALVDGGQESNYTVYVAPIETEMQVVALGTAWYKMTAAVFGPDDPKAKFVKEWELLLMMHLQGDRAITKNDALAWMQYNLLALRSIPAIESSVVQAAFRRLDLAAVRQDGALFEANRPRARGRQAGRGSSRSRSRSRSGSADRRAGRARGPSPAAPVRNPIQKIRDACRDYNLRHCARRNCAKTHVCFTCGSARHRAEACTRP